MFCGFYIFYAITRADSLIADIGLYILAVIYVFYFTYKFMNNDTLNKKLGDRKSYGITCIISLFILFVLFTITTPRLPIFQDPVSGTYGIYMNK